MKELQKWNESELFGLTYKNELIHITNKHTGKMDGMQSISTSCLKNPFCQARIKNGCGICSHCFANAQFKRYATMRKAFEHNTTILSKILPLEWLPFITQTNYKNIFRLESFGDLASVEQVINYFNICEKNKHLTFALWTKNPNLINTAIKYGYKKPSNLIIIFSMLELNAPNDKKQAILNRYDFVDKVFSVYTKDSNVTINCGARNCLTCGRCYNKDTEKFINETLK